RGFDSGCRRAMRARFIYRALKARWRDQRLEIALARALIKPGDRVVDAGANKGAYLYWLQKAVGPGGKVFAYEPQPQLAQYLNRARASMQWQNVLVRDLALSNSSGKAHLHVPGPGVSPGASLEANALSQTTGSSYECSIDTLDHQLENEHPVSFLKIDVEGHELALFAGAQQTLREERPILLFECEARHLAQHSMQDVFNFLRNFLYDGYLLRGSALLPVSQFDRSIHQARNTVRFWDEPNYFNNFLFVPSGFELPQFL
ncbi:MAG TPA: FkbM family methyltransferase, partial [Verrucomicrobiae bacterium]|nr:FkbM family methyltransferase [Verrucomicrobiae bacterium]